MNRTILLILDYYQMFADMVYKLSLILNKILFIIMIFSISYAVIGRLVLHTSPRWCEETGILCMVWMCFLTAAMAIRDGIHIRMTLLEYFLPPKIKKALHIFAYIFLLVLNIIWIFAGWQVVQLTLIPKMPATQFPMAVLFSSVFVSAFLGIIMTVSRLIKGGW